MAASSTTALCFSFRCGLRGYHEYRYGRLPTIHEQNNPYAIAAKPSTLVVETTVGHLPKEISRMTRFMVL